MNAANNAYKIKADPNTMDTYQDYLINETNGSRYAGRIWSDKSVLANNGNNTLLLDMNTDGIDKELKYNDDFLHVYSALGSTILEKTEEPVPVDVVFLQWEWMLLMNNLMRIQKQELLTQEFNSLLHLLIIQ